MARKIIVCIDGTNNEIGDRDTNILKLYKGLDKNTQAVRYIMGVGTNDSSQLLGPTRQAILGLIGQAFGYGLEDDVLDAYRYICREYGHAGERDTRQDYEKDRIYIAGFSRGAYGARILAGFIHNFGLLTPDKLHLVAPVFRAYRRITDSDPGDDPATVFRAMRAYAQALRPQPAPIRALLLFDTVNSMIRFRRIGRNLLRHGSLAEFGTHASVNANVSVRIVLHALAIDERRSLFRAQLWDETGPDAHAYYGNNYRHASRRRSQFVRQRWFPGYHSDIGGSAREDESGIGKITLVWMLDELERMEALADAEDEAHHARLIAGIDAREAKRAAEGKTTPLPRPGWITHAPGLKIKQGHRRGYWEGHTSHRTPGGHAYAGPDPLAPIHDSHWPRGLLAPLLWHLLEIFPKSRARREPGRPRWYRRSLAWWYLPLKEPRRIPRNPDRPEFHRVDESARTRWEYMPRYCPPNLPPRR
ncbi:T6SS phospholipase effector Tle1-like catalytic domain-containing protein [Sinisalibacter aestuarii]|uniref:T6SS Phospholipase effector Tle1-like catalytic domain-containing protein n=1 Tax=Sinisalibacter aestuarii TaxID=2949426 RepID=A0ABQ5LRC3_9RHOB|nr:DUF2235 domain-containing protein [Sinisalibacter aestuarii]GKY87554.1 hypothetical protein STA1M1_14230 [Sinisalibacter aestuarii]